MRIEVDKEDIEGRELAIIGLIGDFYKILSKAGYDMNFLAFSGEKIKIDCELCKDG